MARRRKVAEAINASEGEEPTALIARSKSLVFISHDSRDAGLAEHFANLLADVSAGTLKSFRSSDKRGTSGIGFGAEWYTAIMSQLSDATDVVALLTQRSFDRPWILYEAGVARGKLDTTVLGVALGVPLERVSTGPFGQFQNCADDEDSLTKLVMQLLSRNPDASPREEAVRFQVKLFMERVSETLKSDKELPPLADSDESGAARLFEEVKAMVRELPEQLRAASVHAARMDVRRRPRMNPRALRNVMVHTEFDAATSWLILMSICSEIAPWLHAAGMEVFRCYQARQPNALSRAKAVFRRLLDVSLHPAMREVHDAETHFAMQEIAEAVRPLLDRLRVSSITPETNRQSPKDSPSSDGAG